MKTSAGLLIYKVDDGKVKVLLGHMGGPFFARKDAAAWDIPKGEFEGEDALAAAHREFEEEIGQPAPTGEAYDLGTAKSSNKVVMIWAMEGDIDIKNISSNTFKVEWPPKSGEIQEFPEIDKANWFDLPTASVKIVKSRVVFLERLATFLKQHRPDIAASLPPEQTSLL